MRLVRIGLLAVAVLALAGCGGETKGAGAGGSAIAPASTPAFLAIDSDLSSDQWQALDDLLRSFPGRSQLLQFLRSSLREESGLDYERDVKPALGEELALVWLDFGDGGTNVVCVTKPKDEAAFRRMVEKGNQTGSDQLVLGEVDGWFVLSDTQAKIDRFRDQARKGEKLAGQQQFKDAVAELPDERLVTAYARGDDVLQLIESLAQIPGGGTLFQLEPGQRPEFLAAALAAEGDGLRLVGAARAEQEPKARPAPFESKLLGDVPGDAVAFLTFRGGEAFERQLGQLNENRLYRDSVRELERMLGFRLQTIFELFKNEVAFYIRPETPIPEFTLLLEAPNEEGAKKTIGGVFGALTRTLPAQPCHAPLEQAGVTISCVDFGEVEVRTAAFDGKAVVTTGQRAIEEIRSSGPRLADDHRFQDARKASGLPEANSGFLWVDLEEATDIVLGFLTLADESVPSEVRANLEPLKSLVIWGSAEGRTGSFELFVGID